MKLALLVSLLAGVLKNPTCGYANRRGLSKVNRYWYALRGNTPKTQDTSRDVTRLSNSNSTEGGSYTGCTVVEDFESGPGGWSFDQSSTCTTGKFAIGTPSLMVNAGVVTQVCGDHTTGTGSAFYSAENISPGLNDVDGGVCIATSPVYSVPQDSSVSIWYFHGQRNAGDDSDDFFVLEMSTDGGTNWGVNLASYGDERVNAVWTEAKTTVSAGSDVVFRIQVSDGDARGDLIEAGVDDLVICPIEPNCMDQRDCDDGIFCNGLESCMDGTCVTGSDPCSTKQICAEDTDKCVDCLEDDDCDNGAFCDGAETCASGTCQAGTDPCPGQFCDEGAGKCVDCLDNGDCDNNAFCDGAEICVNGGCQLGSDPCTGQICDEGMDICIMGASMESMVVANVDQDWKMVPLSGFMDPVPVCTIHYKGFGFLPAVVRMRNAVASSFEIKLQNPSGAPLIAQDVNCLVVEEGSWMLPNNKRIDARSYTSTLTDRKGSWVGEAQPDLGSFTEPVVVGQITSYNDSRWSAFWSRGSSRDKPPSSSSTFFAGKHVGEDTATTRKDEIVGYIVIEAGHEIAEDIEYEAGISADSVRGYVSFSQDYKEAFANTPEVAIVSQVAMDGRDGSWAVLSGAQSNGAITLVVDEDQIANAERFHTAEQVAYIAFSSQGSLPLTAA